jgi:hypothetical protein
MARDSLVAIGLGCDWRLLRLRSKAGPEGLLHCNDRDLRVDDDVHTSDHLCGKPALQMSGVRKGANGKLDVIRGGFHLVQSWCRT